MTQTEQNFQGNMERRNCYTSSNKEYTFLRKRLAKKIPKVTHHFQRKNNQNQS